MNVLHGLPIERYGRILGSIKPPILPDPTKVIATIRYSQPILNGESIVAQELYERGRQSKMGPEDKRDMHGGEGGRRVRFVGAWRGLGTHEDGWKSGVQAAEALGARMPWDVSPEDTRED